MFTDFDIYVDEERFPCHKVIIAAVSPYLKNLLTSDMVECAKRKVHLNHIKGELISLVLDYIYYGQITFDKSQLMDMLKAAHYLQIKELIDLCISSVSALLTPKTVLSWLELGQQLDLDELETHSMQFMIENFTDVLNEPAFVSFKIEGVTDFFSNLQGPTVNHDVMLNAAMRWVSHDTGSRTQHLEELMEKVKMEKCSHPALLEVLDKYGAVIGPNLSVLSMMTKALKNLTLQQDEQQDDVQTEEVKEVQDSALPITTPVTPKQDTTLKMARAAKSKQTLVIVGGRIDRKGMSKVSKVCWKMNERRQIEKLMEIPIHDLADCHSVCAIDGGFILTGGDDSDICYMYTAATMSWRKLRKMLRKRYLHGSVCIKGVLYVLGGRIGGSSTNSVDCMVLGTECWESGPNLPHAVGFPKVAQINDRLYLLDPHTRKLYLLDVESGVWRERAPIPHCDIYVSMVSVKGKLAVMGGRARICALYDPTTDVWTEGQQPRHVHYRGSLVYHDDRLLLMGGWWCGSGTDEVEEYSLDDGTWSTTDIKMPAGLRQHYGVVLDSPHNG